MYPICFTCPFPSLFLFFQQSVLFRPHILIPSELWNILNKEDTSLHLRVWIPSYSFSPGTHLSVWPARETIPVATLPLSTACQVFSAGSPVAKTTWKYHRGDISCYTVKIIAYRPNYQHVTMHSSHDKHKLNPPTFRQNFVCWSVRVVQLENVWMDFNKIWCYRYFKKYGRTIPISEKSISCK